jgi:hypothetical protein
LQLPQCAGSFAVTTQTPAHDRLYGGHPHTPEMHSSFEPAGQSVADVHPLPLPPPRPPELEPPELEPPELEPPELEPPELELDEASGEPDEPPLLEPPDPSSPASALLAVSPSLPHATTTPTPSVKERSSCGASKLRMLASLTE